MNDILKLARIQILIIILFAFFKFIRPPVLESKSYEWIKITLLSLPNFFEGILGVLILTGMGLYLNDRLRGSLKRIKPDYIYIIALVFAAIYVITQEFKLHNLGGNNVYDVNDVIFSIIGLGVGYLIVLAKKPVIQETSE